VLLAGECVVACSRSREASRGKATPVEASRGAVDAGEPSPVESAGAPPLDPVRPTAHGLPGGVEVQPLGDATLDLAAVEGVVVRVDLGRVALEPRAVPNQRLGELASDPSLALAVNAGYFESDGAPSGLLAGPSVRFGNANRRGGSGIVVVRAGRAALVPYTSSFSLDPSAELAVQSGPRLLEADGRAGIRSDDGQRAPRTVLCVAEGGRRLDLVLLWTRGDSTRGPGLLALSRALRAPLVASDGRRCEQALNLDGGPSTGFVYGSSVAERPAPEHPPLGPVPWALVVRARPSRPATP